MKNKTPSFDLRSSKKPDSISKIIKNSNSSSQLLVKSHNIISFVSKSQKNSKITNKSTLQKSNESIKSYSVQKPEINFSMKLSHKKKIKMKNSFSNINISMFQNKFKHSKSSKNGLKILTKDTDIKKAALKTFGFKNISFFGNLFKNTEKKNLLSVKNSSNVQSDNNLKRNFAINLTDKIQYNKNSKVNKNESYGCLFESHKKPSDKYKKKNSQYLSINHKIMKRNKSHANHLEGIKHLNFTSISKQKAETLKKEKNFVFDHQRIHSSQKILHDVSSNNLLKHIASHENNNQNEILYMDKSIEVDGDLYNEEHANLYKNSDREYCSNCIQIYTEIQSNCDICKSCNTPKELLISGKSIESCSNCVRIFNEHQDYCVCSTKIRNKKIIFSKQPNILFGPEMGKSIKDLDQLSYFNNNKEKSTKKNNSDNFDYKNSLNHQNINIFLPKYQNRNSLLESNIKTHLKLDVNSDLKKEILKNSNLKKNQHQNIKDFFISSPSNNQKILKPNKNQNILNLPPNSSNQNCEPFVQDTKNSSNLIKNNFPNNSSKLQIKINGNKKFRNGFTNFSKKNIISSIHKKLKGKLNISNKTDIFEIDHDKKNLNNIKQLSSHLKQTKELSIQELKSFNPIEITHREKSLNPFINKTKYMKRNHTTKNLRKFEFQSFKSKNTRKSIYIQ